MSQNAAAASYPETSAQNFPEASFPLSLSSWQSSPDGKMQEEAVAMLEQGRVLLFPQLPFTLSKEEQPYLSPDCVNPSAKTIKYFPPQQKLWGVADEVKDPSVIAGLLKRYAQSSYDLVTTLFPSYKPHLLIGNGSFRPVEAEGRAQSKRHDDRLLHVDSFPSRPTHGMRLLRVFTNIHPAGRARVWKVGEPFANMAARFLPRIPGPFPASAALMKLFKITKSLRTPYDHYMLRLHDAMKQSDAYQKDVPQTTLSLLPGTTWIMFSDQVSHAAISGQHALEQTFILPVVAMKRPETSPLKVLERLKKAPLI